MERCPPGPGGGILKLADIQVGVLLIEGTNCEDESVAYFRFLGARAEKVHLKQLTGDAPREMGRKLEDYDILMVPGGFAAGDYIRAGAIFAARMKKKLGSDLTQFVEAGKPVFGVCNGFQVLVELGLLPALGGTMTETPEAVLAINDSGHYECRPSLLKQENRGTCAFVSKIPRGRVLKVISAHAEGKILFPRKKSQGILKQLTKNDQVVFRYVDDGGRYAGYPWCPSGSTYNIAALCNREGNVFGIQPHPERCFFRYLHPDWTRDDGGDGLGDGALVFQSVLDHVVRKF